MNLTGWVIVLPIQIYYVLKISLLNTTTKHTEAQMINIIATIVFILIIAFFAWLIICSYIYRDKSNDDLTGHQSDRQKENNDYNNDYYP